MSDRKRWRGKRLVAAMALLALFVAAAVYGAGVASGNSADGSTTGSMATSQTNDNGQSYGSKYFAKSVADEPDLIAVVATNGKEGYCYKTDFEGPETKTTEEAVAETKANLRGREVPVFESDGVTRVGVFMIGGPGTTCIGRKSDGTVVTMVADEKGTIVTTSKAPDGSVTKEFEALDGTVTRTTE